MLSEILVGEREMMIAEKASVGREGRWMYRLEHEMAMAVDNGAFSLRITTPQQEDEMFSLLAERAYDGIGELFPSSALMGSGLVLAHGEGGIEQEHALGSPSSQTSARGHGYAEILLYLLEDIDQRRRKGNAVCHGEAQAFGLSRLMIGVLSDDHHLHLVERAEVEGVEDKTGRRIDDTVCVFAPDKIGQFLEIGFVKLPLQA